MRGRFVLVMTLIGKMRARSQSQERETREELVERMAEILRLPAWTEKVALANLRRRKCMEAEALAAIFFAIRLTGSLCVEHAAREARRLFDDRTIALARTIADRVGRLRGVQDNVERMSFGYSFLLGMNDTLSSDEDLRLHIRMRFTLPSDVRYVRAAVRRCWAVKHKRGEPRIALVLAALFVSWIEKRSDIVMSGRAESVEEYSSYEKGHGGAPIVQYPDGTSILVTKDMVRCIELVLATVGLADTRVFWKAVSRITSLDECRESGGAVRRFFAVRRDTS